MLVLSRKLNETIVIDGNIRVTIVGTRGNQVRLGIEAPDRIEIFREELLLPIPADGTCPDVSTSTNTARHRSRPGL
ncbi:MAG: carbon storage regulator CsrA [Planctomycetota bacterium]|nr:carbon storage regulator CsrA [Planctomycetota bacterium]